MRHPCDPVHEPCSVGLGFLIQGAARCVPHEVAVVLNGVSFEEEEVTFSRFSFKSPCYLSSPSRALVTVEVIAFSCLPALMFSGDVGRGEPCLSAGELLSADVRVTFCLTLILMCSGTNLICNLLKTSIFSSRDRNAGR